MVTRKLHVLQAILFSIILCDVMHCSMLCDDDDDYFVSQQACSFLVFHFICMTITSTTVLVFVSIAVVVVVVFIIRIIVIVSSIFRLPCIHSDRLLILWGISRIGNFHKLIVNLSLLSNAVGSLNETERLLNFTEKKILNTKKGKQR